MKLTAQDLLIGGSTLLIVLIVLTLGIVMLWPEEQTYKNASEAKSRWMADNPYNSRYASMYEDYTCNGTSVIQDGFLYCVVGDA